MTQMLKIFHPHSLHRQTVLNGVLVAVVRYYVIILSRTVTMAMDERFPKDSLQLLASLGLDTVPSREQTYREIEERLLFPKETLPEDWLSKYQVWVYYTTLLSH
jgi:hypothetical protein